MAKITNESISRVVLIGAESTGKTTMAAQLAEYYQTPWVPEYLRIFVDKKGGLPEPADIPIISRGHLEQEDHYLQETDNLLFLDTDLITTLVYYRYYFNYVPDWVKRAAIEREADLYLLCDTDIPWKADPSQRDGPGVRDVLQQKLRDELISRNLPFVILSGPIEQRMSTAIKAIENMKATDES